MLQATRNSPDLARLKYPVFPTVAKKPQLSEKQGVKVIIQETHG
jgi:hypothetical protein